MYRRNRALSLCVVAFLMLFPLFAAAEDAPLVAQDYPQAVELLREQLVARDEDFTLLVKGGSLDTEKLYADALSHTGCPREGDYLQAHMIDCIPEISIVKRDGMNYVQVHYAPKYKSTAAMEQEVDKAVEWFFATYPVKEKASQFEKIEAVYAYLCDTIVYDHERKHEGVMYYGEREQENVLIANTAYAGLVEGTCVCEGYAASFYRLVLEMGIDARVVEGFAGEHHAWNIVELDGRYYHLDATWDATHGGQYGYFLQPALWNHEPESEFLKEYRIATADYPLPEKEIYASGEYTYSVTYGACILRYSGSESNVVVPEKLDGIPVVSMQNYQGMAVFTGRGTKDITFPEGFRHARNNCIDCCYDLTKIYLPATFVWSGDEVAWFNNCNRLKSIIVADGNQHIQVIDGILYTPNGKTLLKCPPNHEESFILVAKGVETIAQEAFSGCNNIISVDLPEGLQTISSFAFDKAISLDEINIPSTCTHIGQWAFANTALRALHLPAALEFIGGSVVEGNMTLQEVTVEAGCKNLFVEDGVLYWSFVEGYNNLMIYPVGLEQKTFTLPEHATYIAGGAFNNAQFENIVFNGGLMVINAEAFYMCNNLTEITTPPTLQCIQTGAFWDCMNIKSFTVLNDQAILEENCFGFYNDREKPLLRGHAGSTIENFAKTYDFPFEVIE